MKLFHFVFLFSLSASLASATEITSSLQNLSSDNHKVQTEARNALKLEFADAEGSDYLAMEAEIIGQIDGGLPLENRLYLIRLLEWFGSSASVPTLAALLDDSDPKVQGSARRALASISGDEARIALEQALREASDSQAPALLDALAYRKESRSFGLIEESLESSNAHVVQAAAIALTKFGSADAIPALKKALQGAGVAKLEIARALLSIGADVETAKQIFVDSDNPAVRVLAFEDLMRQDSSAAKVALQSLLATDASVGRSQIIHSAIMRGDDSLRSLCLERLPSASLADKILIVTAIGEADLEQYEADILLELSQAGDAQLRERCIDALGNIGTDRSFDALFDAILAQPKSDVVLNALARLNAPSADIKAVESLRNARLPVADRIASMRVMELRNSPGALEQLNAIAADSSADSKLRESVFKTLESLGNFETIGIFFGVIQDGGALMRPAQRSLKRLSLNLRSPDALWAEFFKPAISEAASDDDRERYIEVLDGVNSRHALNYLKGN
ncbi:MAG: HEAT repeat domain-containing protein, partial [Opitutales bacterium]|nr:HEAT repeat domain-containing protein [Opitutales bacterium]